MNYVALYMFGLCNDIISSLSILFVMFIRYFEYEYNLKTKLYKEDLEKQNIIIDTYKNEKELLIKSIENLKIEDDIFCVGIDNDDFLFYTNKYVNTKVRVHFDGIYRDYQIFSEDYGIIKYPTFK